MSTDADADALSAPEEEIPEEELKQAKSAHPSYGKLNLDVYSPTDISVRIGCHRDTVLREIKKGKLKAKSMGGPIGFRILHDDLVAWLNSPD